MNIIKLNKENIQEILNLEKGSAPDKPFYSKFTEESLRLIFNNNPTESEVFGMYDDKKLVGWSFYREQSENENVKRGSYEIGGLVVDKLYRQQGIAKKILDYIINNAKKSKDYKEICLTVYAKNIAPLVLYLKIGFVIYDFKKDVYGIGSGVDRLYLRLE